MYISEVKCSTCKKTFEHFSHIKLNKKVKRDCPKCKREKRNNLSLRTYYKRKKYAEV